MRLDAPYQRFLRATTDGHGVAEALEGPNLPTTEVDPGDVSKLPGINVIDPHAVWADELQVTPLLADAMNLAGIDPIATRPLKVDVVHVMRRTAAFGIALPPERQRLWSARGWSV